MVNPFKEVNWRPDRAALRQFARSLVIGFPVVGLILFLITRGGPAGLWVAGIGAGAGVLFWLVPAIAPPFYVVWYGLACCMGIVISNGLLILFYYGVMTPIGFLRRTLGHDPMRRRWEPGATTYWRPVEKVVDPRRYFRQY